MKNSTHENGGILDFGLFNLKCTGNIGGGTGGRGGWAQAPFHFFSGGALGGLIYAFISRIIPLNTRICN